MGKWQKKLSESLVSCKEGSLGFFLRNPVKLSLLNATTCPGSILAFADCLATISWLSYYSIGYLSFDVMPIVS